MTEKIDIPVSVGELIDKVSILNIKRVMISDLTKVNLIKEELVQLMDIARPFLQKKEIDEFHDQLIMVNKNIWNAQNEIRKMENDESFDENFIMLSRSIHKLNDRRFQLKQNINNVANSKIIEVKEYQI